APSVLPGRANGDQTTRRPIPSVLPAQTRRRETPRPSPDRARPTPDEPGLGPDPGRPHVHHRGTNPDGYGGLTRSLKLLDGGDDRDRAGRVAMAQGGFQGVV